METTGYMNQVLNAALRGYYRFAAGELPFEEYKNPETQVEVNRETE